MIGFSHKGDFKKTDKFFKKASNLSKNIRLEEYGQMGVTALSNNTPLDSGKTASSWNYEIINNGKEIRIIYTNSNVNKGVNIAIILQYGHGTRNGGYVQGRDYINPAIQPIFDKIAESAWREVIK